MIKIIFSLGVAFLGEVQASDSTVVLNYGNSTDHQLEDSSFLRQNSSQDDSEVDKKKDWTDYTGDGFDRVIDKTPLPDNIKESIVNWSTTTKVCVAIGVVVAVIILFFIMWQCCGCCAASVILIIGIIAIVAVCIVLWAIKKHKTASDILRHPEQVWNSKDE